MRDAGSARPLQRGLLLSSIPACYKRSTVTGTSDKPTREERLAAKLRENLRRRKVQSRELGESGRGTLPKSGDGG